MIGWITTPKTFFLVGEQSTPHAFEGVVNENNK